VQSADEGIGTDAAALSVRGRAFTDSVDADANSETSAVAGPTMALIGVFVHTGFVAKELSA